MVDAEPTGDGEELRRLLTSLSAAAEDVQSFRGRWSSVSVSAARLSAALDDLDRLKSFPLVAELLCSLLQAASSALDLAVLCRTPDPPSARLHTQSNIAAASAALQQLAADADVLRRSDALFDPPEEGSRHREPVREEARSLVIRLQIGSPESRIAALDSLLDLLRDDKNVMATVEQGAVPALVRLLDSVSVAASCHEAREKAAAAIARISAVPSCHHLLTTEGLPLLHHLARVLESDGGVAKEKACLALQTLTQTRDNALIIGSRGGIAALLEICRGGTPSSAQAAAAAVLKNLAAAQELRQKFAEENGVPVIVGVLASGTPLARENALSCLCNLSSSEESQNIKVSIFKEGALESLKNYWEAVEAGEHQNLELGIRLVRNLACFRYIAEAIAASGFLLRVTSALESSRPGARTEAAMAVAELSSVFGRARKEFEGAVTPLVRMLEAKSMEEKEVAAKVVASLMSFPVYQRLLRKEEKGIVNIVQLLDHSVLVDKKFPISILVSISKSRKCRKQMVAAGACGYLQKLAIMEVDRAKKLLEDLGRGKILGVFPRT
ncbi:ARMADILLO BTB ARABIDOPSIS PROTEIN 1-like [Zingiber officinale]|uniref:DUF7032 domain-containing protein n=1 Tax=Zingiber officinale TaxID=94328 RepID=A0A8J5F0Y6_ZINOF|nr:ARMADILLO BTB ARABIDOPSIS PROTEIN 1-like [Zingiber officinale]KAG6476757.1 hypothetical protein ZIOFF_066004 [Zingiber officinale]